MLGLLFEPLLMVGDGVFVVGVPVQSAYSGIEGNESSNAALRHNTQYRSIDIDLLAVSRHA